MRKPYLLFPDLAEFCNSDLEAFSLYLTHLCHGYPNISTRQLTKHAAIGDKNVRAARPRMEAYLKANPLPYDKRHAIITELEALQSCDIRLFYLSLYIQ